MIKVFYGEGRVAAEQSIREFLGDDYEVVDGAELAPGDLPSLMLGASLLTAERAILVRDVLTNRAAAEELVKYLQTPHKVALWELKLDKRSNAYKALKGQVEIREFKAPVDVNAGVAFEVYRLAKRDGAKAVQELRKIEQTEEPLMFFGLMVSQAVRDFAARPAMREKRALKELSKLDMQLKSTKMRPWTLIEAFLMRLGS